MPSITPDLTTAFGAARTLNCPACAALAGDECVYSTAPLSVPVVPGTPVRSVRGYHAARLDAAGVHVAGLTGPAAIVWDNGAREIDATLLASKITALRKLCRPRPMTSRPSRTTHCCTAWPTRRADRACPPWPRFIEHLALPRAGPGT